MQLGSEGRSFKLSFDGFWLTSKRLKRATLWRHADPSYWFR